MSEYRILKLLGRIPGFGRLLADACCRAGIALQKQGSQENAARYFLWSLALVPERPQVLNDLGLALIEQGMEADAAPYLRAAVELTPEMLPAWFNLGLSLDKAGDAEGAIAAFRRVIELKPDMDEAHFHLGKLLHATGRLEEGEASLRRALEIEPDKAATWNNLGNVLSDQGRLAETLAAYRRSLAVKPEPYVFSNLLFALNYSADHTPQQVFDEHLGFQRAFAPDPVPAPPCASAAGRRLRIGYVSPDFRLHPVAFFLTPLLEHHDRERFEIFGYYSHRQQDEYTARIRGLCDRWCETVKFDDERMAQQVRDDRIDILVDLAGHTADNQLLAFARRPAPVQATWLGYLNTTGVDAIDYRITDAVAAPRGTADALHREKLVRLPDSQWCYSPPPDAPEVGPLPALLSGGGLTFGCLHNPAKIAPPVIALWSGILRALPDAKLIVAAAGLDHMADAVAARFTAHGVARGQIEVLGRLPMAEYMDLHGRIDVNLDTFPYSGGTTTCHSLWMGVPVLTLPGESFTSRGGASLLSALGLTEFIAASARDYVDIALRANGNRDRLAGLRAGLRERMRESPIMDGARFALNMEAAYRTMWQEKISGDRA